MSRNIYSYTALGVGPEFVSLNERDGKFFLSVRAPNSGPTVEVELPHGELSRLREALRVESANQMFERM